MRIQCTDCTKRFKTQGSLDMHCRAKHPKQVQARIHAATQPIRRNRMGNLMVGMIGGILGAMLLLGGAIAIAAQGKAIEVHPKTGIISLNPWVTTVHKR
jgi:predicted lipid-binding transport protein (Tim44 family)